MRIRRTSLAPGVSKKVAQALRARGITSLFPIQQQVVPPAIEGRDVLAQSPTGSGKTLAFGIAMAERIGAPRGHVQALVLVPTRELAVQVTEEVGVVAAAHGLRIAAVYGGAALRPQARAASRADIVVATPGRLEDLLQQGLVRLSRVRIMVLDEADRMCDMGFAPQVEKIMGRVPEQRQMLLFSATLEGTVATLAQRYTSDPVTVTVDPPKASRRPIEHSFQRAVHEDKPDALVQALKAQRQLAVVFVRTKRGADRLAKRLRQRGVNAGALHGGMTQNARLRELRAFSDGKIDALVATDVFARGIDLDDITLVVNFDPPEDADTYTHRSGRTGRAGRTGKALTFVMDDQRSEVQAIAEALGLESQYAAAGIELVQRGGQPAGGRSGAGAGAPRRRRRRGAGGGGSGARSAAAGSRGRALAR